MKISIYDPLFSIDRQNNRGIGSEYLAWRLRFNGVDECSIKESNIILVSCVSADQSATVNRFVDKHGKNKKIVIGGHGALSPSIFTHFSDAIVCGDGSVFVDELCKKNEIPELENVISRTKKQALINHDFTWNIPPIRSEDGSFKIFCGIGCKNKCYFCQTSWANKYDENPDPPKLLRTIKSLLSSGKKISYVSNDISQHSFFKSLPKVEHGSYAINFLKKNGIPKVRQIRLGVEGVSERLRKLINKPISFEDLVNSASHMNSVGISVRWFLIAGLPTERKDDWEELKDAVKTWKKITPRGVLALSFTAWCPDPATPLSWFGIDQDYYEKFIDFKSWFFDGTGWSNRIKIMSPQQYKSLITKASQSMDMEEQDLLKNGTLSKNIGLVEYPFISNFHKAIEKLKKYDQPRKSDNQRTE